MAIDQIFFKQVKGIIISIKTIQRPNIQFCIENLLIYMIIELPFNCHKLIFLPKHQEKNTLKENYKIYSLIFPTF